MSSAADPDFKKLRDSIAKTAGTIKHEIDDLRVATDRLLDAFEKEHEENLKLRGELESCEDEIAELRRRLAERSRGEAMADTLELRRQLTTSVE